MPFSPTHGCRRAPFVGRSLGGLFYALLLLFFAGSGLLHAQVQEKRMQEILEPDRNKSVNMEAFKKGFSGKSFGGRNAGRSAYVKEFYGAKSFRGKDFVVSDYNAVRKSTLTERKYGTKKADADGRGGATRMVKAHESKDYAVKEARDASKTASSKTYDARETQWRGPSQDKIDREGPAAMASIQKDGSFRKLETIDDIRKLLNELD